VPGPDQLKWDDFVCASANQLSSPIGDDIAILGLDQGTYYGLKDSGVRIWELLQMPIRIGDVHAALVEEFDVDEGVARNDLIEILGQLLDARLIEIRHERAP
jgi:hypothetical protein